MHSWCASIDGCTHDPYCQDMAEKGAHLEAHYQEVLDREIEATRRALTGLTTVVSSIDARLDEWSGHTAHGVMDDMFVLDTIQDLGRLKQRADKAIKQLAIHAVRDRHVPASTVARELGVAHTTVARWAQPD